MKNKGSVPVPQHQQRHEKSLAPRPETPSSSFVQLRDEMDHLLEDFFGRESLSPGNGSQWGQFMPEIDVENTDKEIRVSAELPGLDEKDIQLSITDGVLFIEGEKRREQTQEKGNFYHTERSYGSFYRSIALPAEVEEHKAKASFKNGVLRITLPKAPEAHSKSKKLEITKG